jgi:hypothetical protein
MFVVTDTYGSVSIVASVLDALPAKVEVLVNSTIPSSIILATVKSLPRLAVIATVALPEVTDAPRTLHA